MFKIALRGFRASFLRFLLTLFSVILGSAFLTGTLALRDALQTQLQSIAQTVQIDDLYVQGAKTSAAANAAAAAQDRMAIPDTLTAELADIDGLKIVAPQYMFAAAIQDFDGNSLTGGSIAPTMVFASQMSSPDYRTLHVEGKLPEGNDEIIAEVGIANSLGLHIGDRFEVVYGDIIQPVTMVGTIDFGSTMAGANVLLMDSPVVADMLKEQRRIQATAQMEAEFAAEPAPEGVPPEIIAAQQQTAIDEAMAQLDDEPLQIESIAIEVAEGTDIAAVKTAIEDKIAASWQNYDITEQPEVLTRDESIKEINAQIEQQVGFVNTFLLVFVGVALFVSIFIISNTFRMIVQSQQQQFAMLRAIGASRRHIFAIVASQGIAIGVLGSILGVGLGSLLAQALRNLLANFNLELSNIPVTPGVIGTTLGVGITVTFLGALLPARAAAKIPPVAAMREAQLGGQRTKVWPAILGAILVISGSGLCWYSTQMDNDYPGTLLAIGMVGALLGVLMLTPALTFPLMSLLGLPARVLKPIGQLAQRNVLRNPRRTAATASALTIGVSLVVLGAVMAETMRDATSGVVDEQLRAEFTILSQAGKSIESTELMAKLRDLDGVDYVNDQISGNRLEIKAPGDSDFAQDIVIACDPDSIGRDFVIPNVEGDLDAFIHPQGDDMQVLVARRLQRDADLHVGDTVQLKGEKSQHEAVIAAFIESAVLKRNYAISIDDAKTLGAPLLIKNTVLIKAADNADLQQLKADIDQVLQDYDGLAAYTKEEYKDQIADAVNVMLAIVYALLALSMIIAIFGIINTQSLSISERIREIGLLRAVGLGRGRIATMVVIESILTALLGVLLGFIAGTGLSWALIEYLINSDVGITRMVFPTSIIGYTVIAAVLIGSIAGIVPAIRAARIRLLTAIATE